MAEGVVGVGSTNVRPPQVQLPWTDEQLIRGLKAGRADAVEQMLHRFGNRLLRGAVLLLKDHQLAEDVVQETFLSALRGIRNFRGEAGLYTWLYKIAVNHCRRILRRRDPVLLGEDAVANHGSEDAALMRKEEKVALTKALADLPYIYREAIVLHYYFEMTVDEIAEATETPAGTIKSRLARGRNLLETLMSEVMSLEHIQG